MTGTNKGIVLSLLCGVAVLVAFTTIGAGTLTAGEPLLLIYPDQPTVFRYDPSRFEILDSADPKFDNVFGISGRMLWDKIEQRVPQEVYRAPGLLGFEPSPYGMNEFVVMRNEFLIIVDGYGPMQRTFHNLYMRFIPYPSHSPVQVRLQSQLLDHLVVSLPALVVSTPVGDGYYSDTMRRHLGWSGATGLRITAYSDKDGDGLYSGGKPLFSIFAEDNTVRTEETTWGAVKALYSDR